MGVEVYRAGHMTMGVQGSLGTMPCPLTPKDMVAPTAMQFLATAGEVTVPRELPVLLSP